MRGFETGVGSKADIGAPPLTQLSFMRTRPSAVIAQAPFCFRPCPRYHLDCGSPPPVCPSPRPQDSIATVKEQTANTIPAAEEALAGPGAGNAVALECGPCPTGRGPDRAKGAHTRLWEGTNLTHDKVGYRVSVVTYW